MTWQPDRLIAAVLATALLASPALFVGSGCARGVYRASVLPVEYIAPAPTNLEAINLSGLADRSISCEIIQPGDVLDVTMVTDYTKLTTSTTPIRVGDDGAIVVPLVGKVGVNGLSAEQAEQVIAVESINRGVFRNPCVTVTMKQYRTNRVTVVGAVNQPGTHELPRGSSSLLAALMAAGGLCEDASTDVEIRHTDHRDLPGGRVDLSPRVANAAETGITPAAYETPATAPSALTVSLIAATSGAQKVPELHDGDVVYVAKRTLPPVYVLGLVARPGEFSFPPNQELRVLDSLAMAGGCSNPVAEKVLVIRHLPNRKEPIQIAVSIQAAKNGRDNIALAPGDTIMVEQTPQTVMIDIMKSFIHFTFGSNPLF